MNNVSLVAMETGSDWPGRPEGSADVVVVRDDTAGLLRHTQEKLDALRSKGRSLSVAVLACNDGACGMPRARVASALLAAVSGADDGRLVLSAREQASLSLRRELLALAGELTLGLPGTSVTISLRFQSGLASSGRVPT